MLKREMYHKERINNEKKMWEGGEEKVTGKKRIKRAD